MNMIKMMPEGFENVYLGMLISDVRKVRGKLKNQQGGENTLVEHFGDDKPLRWATYTFDERGKLRWIDICSKWDKPIFEKLCNKVKKELGEFEKEYEERKDQDGVWQRIWNKKEFKVDIRYEPTGTRYSINTP